MLTDLFSSKKNLLDLYLSLHSEDKSVELEDSKGEIAEMLLEEMSIEEIVGTAEENRAEKKV